VPQFGPLALVEVRVSVAALVLLPWLARHGELAQLRRYAAPVTLLGALNSALPFALFSYATLTVTAGFAAILNATVPLWTGLIAWLWLRQRIGALQWLGLVLGLAGVAVLVWGKVGFAPGRGGWEVTLAVAAGLFATAAYGLAANYTRERLAALSPRTLASGSQLAAALALLPLAVAFRPATMPGAGAWLAAIALGVVCTALAYLLYFRLLARVGAMRAAAVTFLIPAFATLWGALFLSEPVTLQLLLGGVVILAGTALSLGLVRVPAPRAAAAVPRMR
jgi:drug/metabolite transporter (DMT)-like permease